MEKATELPIKQIDGTVEHFNIIYANDISGAEIPPGEYHYWVYKSSPYTCFFINVLQKENGLYVRSVGNNYHAQYTKKNIVFPALCFIADRYKLPVYSSAVSSAYSLDDTDLLVPETMGERWPKMLERYPDRVKYLAQQGRYVLLPNQADEQGL
jgi:hypothetical protein